MTFGLIHEYHTTQAIAEAIAAMVGPLPESIEPSAGLGRLIRAFTSLPKAPQHQGTIGLVVSNPPYGRGEPKNDEALP